MRKPNLIMFSLFGFVALIVVFTIGLSTYLYHDGNNIEKIGTLGDFIGGVLNPILSYFTFIAILYTISIQSEELRLSHEVLQQTKGELEQTRKIAKEQIEHLKREAKKNELNRIITDISNDINNALLTKHRWYGEIIQLKNKMEPIISHLIQNIEHIKTVHDFKEAHETIADIYRNLVQMNMYLIEYSEIDSSCPYIRLIQVKYGSYAVEILRLPETKAEALAILIGQTDDQSFEEATKLKLHRAQPA